MSVIEPESGEHSHYLALHLITAEVFLPEWLFIILVPLVASLMWIR
jgi:hypothetical protein